MSEQNPSSTLQKSDGATGGSRATSGLPIELENITKRYPGQQAPAVEDVSMTIPGGETVIFVGPSGCGKTTTMKMINKLIEPTSGRIKLGDEDVTKLEGSELRRRMGYAIQQAGLFPHMTIAKNVGQVPKMLGWDAKRISARVDEMLDLTGLDPAVYRDRYPRQLSGGQQQRVGVARALAADPPVLLMDEPFGAVDPITRGNLQDELLNLQAQLGKTIVFVTHDFDEAIKLGDKIAVLGERSSIQQFDSPANILAAPANEMVAGFVGQGATIRQLGLKRVRELTLGSVPTAKVTDTVETGRAAIGNEKYLLLVDGRGRPAQWVRRASLQSGSGSMERIGGRPIGDTVSTLSTLSDALDAILTEGGGSAAVTGERGEYVGTVTIDQIMGVIQEIREQQDSREAGDS